MLFDHAPKTDSLQELTFEQWTVMEKHHRDTLSVLLNPYLEKRSRHQKNPVMDFLFEYFKFRPSHLMKWSPGLGVLLDVEKNIKLPEISQLKVKNGQAWLPPARFPLKRRRAVKWTLEMLKKSSCKKPLFGCFGMHEWAMVYRAEEIRHEQVPLRLSQEEIAQFVESRPLVCTHFDAFRFFTEKARPMNKHKLNHESFEEMEQPGCIHTNMDLYKWAYKFYPWISSELIRKAFLNALKARKVDMQASPYNVTAFGLEPIKIETEEGRKTYLEKQMDVYRCSIPIREELIKSYNEILSITNL